MKINSIQYLRALAALLVVYCHAMDVQVNVGVSHQQHFHYLENFGAIGVDIFFVISGFIITLVSENTNGIADAKLFLKRRFFRINPSYYLVSALFLALLYATTAHVIFPTERVIKTLTILPLFDSKEFIDPVITVGWTLSFEWLFYLIFSALILFRIKRKDIVLCALLVLLTLFSFLPGKNVQMTFITNPMLWEFCFGVFIAIIYQKYTINKWLAFTMFLASLAAYALLIYKGYGKVDDAGTITSGENAWMRVCLWGIPSAMLVFGLLFMEKAGLIVLKNPFILLIGDASYAIYLLHLKCLGLMLRYPGALRLLPMDLLIFILVMICTAIGIAYYVAIERRMNNYFKKFLQKKQAKHQML